MGKASPAQTLGSLPPSLAEGLRTWGERQGDKTAEARPLKQPPLSPLTAVHSTGHSTLEHSLSLHTTVWCPESQVPGLRGRMVCPVGGQLSKQTGRVMSAVKREAAQGAGRGMQGGGAQGQRQSRRAFRRRGHCREPGRSKFRGK